jgi:galactarate dehydratase
MLTQNKHQVVIKVHELDNVGIVPAFGGYDKGVVISDGTVLQEHIPMGHKVALTEIGKGTPVIRYGQIIGNALDTIQKGAWVNEHNISLPELPNMEQISIKSGIAHSKNDPLKGYTFKGYRNSDGSVGTKNLLGITTSVQCVAGMAEYVAKKIKNELLPHYPNVDGVVALNHHYGCGVAINAPEAAIPINTIKNIARNPNFGGEVLIIGLGCEKLRPEWLLNDQDASKTTSNILYMQDEAFHGFSAMVDGFMEMAEKRLKKLNLRERETCPVSDLVVGMQCGGSDAFSGLTGNPAAGYAADLLVRAGGSVMFSEVTEVRDAIHLLIPRAMDDEVRKALIREMQWYDDYLDRNQTDRSSNPSPGNKRGGLSNVVEKALGSIAKSGSSPIVDVIGPGERLRKKGLNFAATPASDFVCGTLQLAAGMNLHVFITGRGTPYGLEQVPVIKIGTNSNLSQRWHDLIDLDAGPIANGEKTVEEVGWELFHLMLEVASGEQQVAADKLELHNDLALFNPGPLT